MSRHEWLGRMSHWELCSGSQGENQRERKEKHVSRPFKRTKKKLWNIKITVILTVIGVFEIIPKDLIRRLEMLEIGGEQRPSKLQDCEEYWEESWRLEETCGLIDSSERPSANAGVKNSQGIIIIIKMIIINDQSHKKWLNKKRSITQ